jgi:hypothetical protein
VNGIVSVGYERKSLYFPTVVVVSSYTRRRLVFPGLILQCFIWAMGEDRLRRSLVAICVRFVLLAFARFSSVDGISDGSAWRRGRSSFVATF